MAKDRRIADPGGVSAGDKHYKPGQEDGLAKELAQWQIDELLAKGVLEGDWSAAAGVEPPEVAVAGAAAPVTPRPKRRK